MLAQVKPNPHDNNHGNPMETKLGGKAENTNPLQLIIPTLQIRHFASQKISGEEHWDSPRSRPIGMDRMHRILKAHLSS